MAEAILVMTILGIIAAVMITTLKPAEFKEKSLRVLAKKVLSEIDTATTQILSNDAKLGTMTSLSLSDGVQFEFKGNADKVLQLYQKYLVTIRTTVPNDSFCVTGDAGRNATAVYFKDGACMGIYAAEASNAATIFPGETATTEVTAPQGLLLFDTNGEDEPNIIGVDRFTLPVGTGGIGYDLTANATPSEPLGECNCYIKGYLQAGCTGTFHHLLGMEAYNRGQMTQSQCTALMDGCSYGAFSHGGSNYLSGERTCSFAP